MKKMLAIVIALLMTVSISSYADTTVKQDVPGTYLGGTTATGIDCTGTTGVCFSRYVRVKTPPASPGTKTALYVPSTNDGVCDIDGTNTSTNSITGDTHTTVQTNSNTFYVNNLQDLLDWINAD